MGIVHESIPNAQLVFLDEYTEYGDVMEFLRPFIISQFDEPDVNVYFVTFLQDTCQKYCTWAFRLLFLSNDELAMVGGINRHGHIWKKFASVISTDETLYKCGRIPVRPVERLYPLGLVCSRFEFG